MKFSFWRREYRDKKSAKESESHLQAAQDLPVPQEPAREAEQSAVREIGNRILSGDASREIRGSRWLEELAIDVRFALRMLGKNRRFACVAILTLGLGIGATTAVFSLFDTIYAGTLPFRDADRLIRLRDSTLTPDGRRIAFNNLARTILEVQRGSRLFSGVAALDVQDMNVVGTRDTQRVHVVGGSAGWIQVMGLRPLMGRAFSEEEGRQGRSSGVGIVSYGFWQSHFGGSPEILGKSIALNDRTYTIIGVFGPAFRFPYHADVWIPEKLDASDRTHEFAVYGRMNDGVTFGQVREEMAAISARTRQTYPDLNPGYSLEVRTLRQSLFENQERMSLMLGAVVGFLLAVACANIANLLLARSVIRQKEFAIRTALGAGSGRQLRQLLTESVTLSVLGALCGLLVSVVFGKYLTVLIPSNIADQLGIQGVRLDFRILGFAIIVALLAGILSGITPALRSRTRNLQGSLRESGRSGLSGLKHRRLLGALVISEVAFALVLLSGAGMLLENLMRMEHRDLGLRAEKLLTLELTPPEARYTDAAQRLELARQILEQVKRIPGVTAAGILLVNPLGGADWSAQAIVEGATAASPESPFIVNYQLAGAGVLHLMGIPVLLGREFTEHDTQQSEPVMMVSESMARRFWPGENPIGKRARLAPVDVTRPWRTVVGVVGDVAGNHEPGFPPETWYSPFEQEAGSRAAASYRLMVRVAQETPILATDVKTAVFQGNKSVAVGEASYMDNYYTDSLSSNRTSTILVELFALAGIVLAAVGIHGVMSFTVSQRTHEIGLRMALGAGQWDVLRMVMGQGLWLALSGVALGLVAATGVTDLMARLIYGTTPGGATMFISVSALVLGVALVACYFPARRASSVDPNICLKYE